MLVLKVVGVIHFIIVPDPMESASALTVGLIDVGMFVVLVGMLGLALCSLSGSFVLVLALRRRTGVVSVLAVRRCT